MTARLPNEVIEKGLGILNQSAQGEWKMLNNKLRLELTFESFRMALEFMNVAANYAEKFDHHPVWCNIYNRVIIDLLTHEVGGITEKDFELAAAINGVASQFISPEKSAPDTTNGNKKGPKP